MSRQHPPGFGAMRKNPVTWVKTACEGCGSDPVWACSMWDVPSGIFQCRGCWTTQGITPGEGVAYVDQGWP